MMKNQALFFSSEAIYLFHVLLSRAERMQKLALQFPGRVLEGGEEITQFGRLFKSMRRLKSLRISTLQESTFFL